MIRRHFPWIVFALAVVSAPIVQGYECGDGHGFSRAKSGCPMTVDPCADPYEPAEGPVFFRQEPSVLTSEVRAEVRVQELYVAGDFPSLRHKLPDGSATSWTRRTLLLSVCGRPVSVFDLAWPSDVAREVIRATQVGTDQPWIDWGTLWLPGATKGIDLRLRFASKTLTKAPPVPVQRVNGDVQFTRHLVNLRMPNFGASRIGSGDMQLYLHQVARLFYEHFQSEYTALAIYPHEVHTTRNWGGFQTPVRNAVEGINHNWGVFDCSSAYGDCGQLDAMHFYPDSEGLTHNAVTHELAHHYGHYFDWTILACVELPDRNALVHAPLWRGPPTLVGLNMAGEYEVRPGERTVTRTATAPFTYHPFTLYGMGLLPDGENPSVELARDQGQLVSGKGLEGTVLKDDWVRRSLRDIERFYGERKGPKIPEQLGFATVVVSRDRLLDEDELKFWNYYARRQGEADSVSWTGYGSIEASTAGSVKVETEIIPRADAKAAEWSFGGLTELHPQDWTEIELDQALPLTWSASAAGTVDFSGRVLVPSQGEKRISLHFFEGDAPEIEVLDKWFRIDGGGRYRAHIPKSDFPPGRYLVDVCLRSQGDCRLAGPRWTVLTESASPWRRA